MTRDYLTLNRDVAQRSLDAIETCLAFGRIDAVTRRALRADADYERERIRLLDKQLQGAT